MKGCFFNKKNWAISLEQEMGINWWTPRIRSDLPKMQY